MSDPDELSLPRLEEAKSFLHALWPNDPGNGVLSLCSGGRVNGQQTPFRAEPFVLSDLEEIAHRGIERIDTNIYISVSAQGGFPKDGRGTEKGVRFVPALWADLDFKCISQDRLNQLLTQDLISLPPALLIHSGNGYQAYWPLDVPICFDEDETDRPRVRALNTRLWQWLNEVAGISFDNVSSLEHIMRLPGTFNRKDEGPKHVSLEWNTGHRYTREHLDHFLPSLAAIRHEPRSATSRGKTSTTRASVEDLFDRYVLRVKNREIESRNTAAYLLIQQLLFNGYPMDYVQSLGARFKVLVDELGDHPYELSEWDNSLRSASNSNLVSRGTIPEVDSDRTFEILSGPEVRNLPQMTFLVEDVIPEVGTFQVFGRSGGGKSYVVLDLLLSVANGASWLGCTTNKAVRALYVVAEGGATLGQRLFALMVSKHLDDKSLFVMIEQNVNLLDDMDIGALVRSVEAALPGPPGIVIFDTQSLSMPGGEENSARDMSRLAANLKLISQALACVVGTVHHTGHDNAERARGSSAQQAAWDVEFRFDGAVLTQTKNRYAPKAQPIGVKFESVEFVDDRTGKTISERVPWAVPVYSAVAANDLSLQRRILRTVAEFPGIGANDLFQQIKGSKPNLDRTRGALVADGFIENRSNGRRFSFFITPKGEEFIAGNSLD